MASKFIDWLTRTFGLAEPMLAAGIESIGKDKFVELFEKLRAKNPATYKTTLTALYPLIDVQLEGVTDQTKTKIDDAIVDALKGAIEESAFKNGVALSNLDAD